MSLSKKQRRQRLVVLADFLENEVKPALNGAKFSMAVWGMVDGSDPFPCPIGGQEKSRIRAEAEVPSSISAAKECGYAACAAGWALTCPSLRRAVRKVASVRDYGLTMDFEDLADVFGLSYRESEWAFDSCEYASGNPRLSTVADRLRKLAAQEPAT